MFSWEPAEGNWNGDVDLGDSHPFSHTPLAAKAVGGAASSWDGSVRLPGSSTVVAEHDFLRSSFKPLSTVRRTATAGPASSRRGDAQRDALPSTVVALIDNRAGEVGIAACDLRGASITLFQFGDHCTLSKTLMQLTVLHPCEILLAHTTLAGKLSAVVSRHFSSVAAFTAVHRREFNESKGAQRLSTLMASPESAPQVLHTDRYLCLAAAHALIKFLEAQTSTIFIAGTVRVQYLPVDAYLEMDRATARGLQIIAPVASKRKKKSTHNDFLGADSLAEALDHTITVGGRRMLRVNLLQPPRHIDTIHMRHEAVQFLIDNKAALVVLRRLLLHVESDDMEATVAAFAYATKCSTTTGRTAAALPVADRDDGMWGHWRDAAGTPRDYVAPLITLRRMLVTCGKVRDELGRFLCDPTACDGDNSANNAATKRNRGDDSTSLPGASPYAPHRPALLCSLHGALVNCSLGDTFLSRMDVLLDEDVVSGKALRQERGAAEEAMLSDPEEDGDAFAAQRTSHRIAARRNASSSTSACLAKTVQSCFAAKASLDAVLDLARRRLSEVIEAIYQYGESLRHEHKIPSLRVRYDASRQFFLSYDAHHDVLAPPDVFVRKCESSGKQPAATCSASGKRTSSKGQKSQRITCTTTLMATLRSQFVDAVAEVTAAQAALLQNLVHELRAHMSRLHAMCEAVALLDLLCSFAHFCRLTTAAQHAGGDEVCCARPQMVVDGPLIVPQMQHLVMSSAGGGVAVGGPASSSASSLVVPCDIHIDELRPLVILSGPNASGKSTFLRSVGHAAVIAHVGCFVPSLSSSSAVVRVRLLDRVVLLAPAHHHDAASSSQIGNFVESSFFTEMRNVAFTCNVASRASLVLVDEVGRGTSHLEGAHIAQAFVEWLADVKCIAVVATHMTRLLLLAADEQGNGLAGVQNQHMAVAVRRTEAARREPIMSDVAKRCRTQSTWRPVESSSASLSFQYTVHPGSCQVQQYGIALAGHLQVSKSLLAFVPRVLRALECSASTSRVHHAVVASSHDDGSKSPPNLREKTTTFPNTCSGCEVQKPQLLAGSEQVKVLRVALIDSLVSAKQSREASDARKVEQLLVQLRDAVWSERCRAHMEKSSTAETWTPVFSPAVLDR